MTYSPNVEAPTTLPANFHFEKHGDKLHSSKLCKSTCPCCVFTVRSCTSCALLPAKYFDFNPSSLGSKSIPEGSSQLGPSSSRVLTLDPRRQNSAHSQVETCSHRPRLEMTGVGLELTRALPNSNQSLRSSCKTFWLLEHGVWRVRFWNSVNINPGLWHWPKPIAHWLAFFNKNRTYARNLCTAFQEQIALVQ